MPRQSNDLQRILIVDDNEVVRYALRKFIEEEERLAVCGEASTVDEALILLEKSKPDLVLLDLNLDGESGFILLKKIRTKHSDVVVIVVSMHSESLYGVNAIELGAKGYVMKSDIAEHLFQAIDTVNLGQLYISDFVRGRLPKSSKHKDS